ncbi:transcription factor TGA2.3-like [Primulina eburnea]|uniref:transcription factor TGA2.3-like n=1 Tax=Primulina eburnea TaxID=1245227 RepID=UPI003C6C8113
MCERKMQSFKASVHHTMSLANNDLFCHSNSPFYYRVDEGSGSGTRFAELGELEQSTGNGPFDHAVNLTINSIYNDPNASSVSVLSNNLQFGGINASLGSSEMGSAVGGVDSAQFMLQKGGMMTVGGGGALGNGPFENWGDSGVVADHSQQTDASTDTDEKNQFPGVHNERLTTLGSTDPSDGKTGEQKVLRRLAQNREAAKKSRIRKKAYVQQLESSRQKLTQLEQELKRARQQGIFATPGFTGDHSHSNSGNGALAFDMEYARWREEHKILIEDLRSAVNSNVGDSELRGNVDAVMSHYDEVFRLKSVGAKSDVFHMLSGMWKAPTERCFMWLGGFRSSEVLKIPERQIQPLTEQQLMRIRSLQQSSQQAEDALSQGMEALQQTLVDTLSSISSTPRDSGYVSDYMEQMSIAMSKLAALENFLHQADILRQQTLQQLQRILTTRQAARALLAINDYKSRLQALSSLWWARPRE